MDREVGSLLYELIKQVGVAGDGRSDAVSGRAKRVGRVGTIRTFVPTGTHGLQSIKGGEPGRMLVRALIFKGSRQRACGGGGWGG